MSRALAILACNHNAHAIAGSKGKITDARRSGEINDGYRFMFIRGFHRSILRCRLLARITSDGDIPAACSMLRIGLH